MKLPAIDKEKALQVLLAHGDKVVVGGLAILAAVVAWGGIDAIRLKSVSSQRQPRTILDGASRATGHIDRLQEPTAAVRVKPTPLAERVGPWQAPEIASVASGPVLDQPLFQELSRRTKPDVFPIEQLTTTAGLAVLPAAEAPGQARQPVASRARIVPFVVVTGLVPVAKQRAEYERRFSQTSHRDSKLDQPVWDEYLIERAEVKPGGGEEKWQRIDLRAAAQKARAEWAGVQPESLPPELSMPETKASDATGPQAVSFAGYRLPLPKLASGAWGPETIHPAMLDAVRAAWSKQPVESPYRLFRFIDTEVAPGQSYRYRVRLSVLNPNWKLEARHVDAAATAGPEKLASLACDPSPAAAVPDPTSVLVRSLSKADMKRFKSGAFEALVIGESVATGTFAVRSMITEVGGIVNVDARLNKPGDTRARGEDIRTDRVIVDARGRQNDRGEERSSGRIPLPPEPFEVLVLKPDGSFEVASVADSQAVIDANVATLPAIESPAKGPRGERGPRGDDGPAPAIPF